MKIRFILSIVLILLLISGIGCVKKEEPVITGGIDSGEKEEPVVIKKEIENSELITERTKGLDLEQETYFYYKINKEKGMKISADSENSFSIEIMNDEECRKKTKNEDYNAEIKEDNVKIFEFESREEDIKEEDKEWCVVATNRGDKYTSIHFKIEELTYNSR